MKPINTNDFETINIYDKSQLSIKLSLALKLRENLYSIETSINAEAQIKKIEHAWTDLDGVKNNVFKRFKTKEAKDMFNYLAFKSSNKNTIDFIAFAYHADKVSKAYQTINKTEEMWEMATKKLIDVSNKGLVQSQEKSPLRKKRPSS